MLATRNLSGTMRTLLVPFGVTDHRFHRRILNRHIGSVRAGEPDSDGKIMHFRRGSRSRITTTNEGISDWTRTECRRTRYKWIPPPEMVSAQTSCVIV